MGSGPWRAIVRRVPVPGLNSSAWDWGEVERREATFLGRGCLAIDGVGPVLADAELADGTVELDLAVPAGRSFHGILWRARGSSYESFFVRPHQVGNPDAIQYTPAFYGVSSWQLYHGEGFWAPVTFPLDEWFTIRVVFERARAEFFVGDLETPALVSELRTGPGPGRVGLLAGGPGLRVSRFECDTARSFRGQPRESVPLRPGVLRSWEVSEAFPEGELAQALESDHTWTAVDAEPTGLLDLARVQGIRDGQNTVLARTRISSPRPETRLLELGFSDRAVAYLDGRPIFRGDDSYRSRDYRFLGSIGWYDALFLPLREGENELVVAVSEDFGGWGVQARLAG